MDDSVFDLKNVPWDHGLKHGEVRAMAEAVAHQVVEEIEAGCSQVRHRVVVWSYDPRTEGPDDASTGQFPSINLPEDERERRKMFAEMGAELVKKHGELPVAIHVVLEAYMHIGDMENPDERDLAKRAISGELRPDDIPMNESVVIFTLGANGDHFLTAIQLDRKKGSDGFYRIVDRKDVDLNEEVGFASEEVKSKLPTEMMKAFFGGAVQAYDDKNQRLRSLIDSNDDDPTVKSFLDVVRERMGKRQ